MELGKLALHTIDGIQMVKMEKVTHLKADGCYTNVYLDDKSKIVVTKTLKELDQLLKIKNFCRIHKSYLINLDKLEKYKTAKGNYVIMENGTQIEVARRRKDTLMTMLTGVQKGSALEKDFID